MQTTKQAAKQIIVHVAQQKLVGLAINSSIEALNKSFDKLRTNGKVLIPFIVSLSNHDRNQLVQRFLKALI
jgi:hypothetical protein